MTDIVNKRTRSRMMSGIRGRDTRPERTLRKALHARGFRYRLNVRRLPGSPDMVLPKRRAVVFVHGCFWHRHPGCAKATTPSSNVQFWQRKFLENVERDERNILDLEAAGWRVAVVWECALKRQELEDSVERLSEFLNGDQQYLELPV